MTTLTITVPDDLAVQLEAMDLLHEEALVTLLEDAVAVRRQRTEHLFESADRLAALDFPTMSTEEVQAEIVEARASRRAGRP